MSHAAVHLADTAIVPDTMSSAHIGTYEDDIHLCLHQAGRYHMSGKL